MQAIGFPYKGSRGSYHVYHPAKHGPPTMDGQWQRAKAEFVEKLKDFVAVCELYTDQQTMHESVGGEEWKREILRFVESIERDGSSVYELEALCECLFDVDEKTSQRSTTYHSEIKKMAEEIRFDDSGLISPIAIDPGIIQKVGFTGR